MQTIPSARASAISFNEGLLRLAALHGRHVEFRYVKSDKAPVETRCFVPHSVAVSNNGDVVVLGDDEDRGALRGFRLDRIKGDVRVA